MAEKVILALACLAISAAGFEYRTESSCDFSGIDLDGPINRMLSKLPAYELSQSPLYKGEFAGVDFLGLNFTGLNKLQRYGAIAPFCVDGIRKVQVDFAQHDDLALIVPWKTCKGRNGILQLKPLVSRITTIFRIEANELGQVTKLVHEGPVVPVATEQLKASVHGGGFFLSIMTEYLSYAFPAFLREIWNQEFYPMFEMSVKKVLA
uniref:Putative secreted protein n=1 Tax=Amblyomma triste TaxID=251400 RepID=A0A023GE37_AMBTT